MTEHLETRRHSQELSPLTDSLASCIRWRLSDYEAVLRGEMDILLDTETTALDAREPEAEPLAPGERV